MTPSVYALIPCFNRVSDTEYCIKQLEAQTYPQLKVIVADGGSTDRTPEIIRRQHPTVVVLQTPKEAWWSGSISLAIEHALRVGRDDDLLLFMNNDSRFDSNYVSVLVAEQRAHGGAVGSLTVDLDNADEILNAGTTVSWPSNLRNTRRHVEPGETFNADVDVLPGRGTIVPLQIVREVGNIDANRLPHYRADEEFFSRIKRHGYPLGVSFRAVVRDDRKTTGSSATDGADRGIFQKLQLLWSRSSKSNAIDHYRFIEAAAPEEHKRMAKRILYRGIAIYVLEVTGVLSTAYRAGSALLPVYFVTQEQCDRFGIDPQPMLDRGILAPSRVRDEYVFTIRRWRIGSEPERTLFKHARSKGQRIPILTDMRASTPSRNAQP